MSNEKRRKLLKSIAAGSGAVIAGKSLPGSWSRPVVDVVAMPAHAQTSGRIYSDSLSVGSLEQDGETLFARLSDALIARAEAQTDNAAGCAIEMGGVFDVWIQYLQTFPQDIINEWTGTLDPAAASNMLKHTQDNGCNVLSMPDIEVTITELTDAGITVSISGYGPVPLVRATACVAKLPRPACVPG